MISNQAPLFGGRNEHDEALTVQVSDANSHLGHLLLEADWDELTNYLDTDEGKRDVDANNDPLGLFREDAAKKRASCPNSEQQEHCILCSTFRSCSLRRHCNPIRGRTAKGGTTIQAPLSHHDRTRTWTSDEYYRILDLLLQAFIATPPSLSQPKENMLLQFRPGWMIGSGDALHHDHLHLLTPLAIAAYNPDVPASIVQNLCALQPHAMEKSCQFNGHATIPLIVAAASPLPDPIDSLSKFESARDLRWEKVTLLTLHKGWYHGWYDKQRGILKEAVDAGKHDIRHPLEVSPRPEPTAGQIKDACEEAQQYNEWELVREFLKRNDGKSMELETFQVALTEHDERTKAELESEDKKSQHHNKAKERDNWLHRNMGLVMYPIDAVVDLVQTVIPKGMLKKHTNVMDLLMNEQQLLV